MLRRSGLLEWALRDGFIVQQALKPTRLTPLETERVFILGLVMHTQRTLTLLSADFARTRGFDGPWYGGDFSKKR